MAEAKFAPRYPNLNLSYLCSDETQSLPPPPHPLHHQIQVKVSAMLSTGEYGAVSSARDVTLLDL